MFVRSRAVLFVLVLLVLAALACSLSGDEKTIYLTATPLFDAEGNPIVLPTNTPNQPTNTPLVPTPNPTRAVPQTGSVYVVQPGDTLGQIATLYGVTVEEILALNQLANPDALEVGQPVNVPGGNVITGPEFKLIPDSELVRSPSSLSFSTAGFVKYQQGFLRAYSEDVGGDLWSGVEIIEFVSRSYSISPRLLLALLEFRSGWVTDLYPSEEATRYPLGLVREGREGLYRQMLDTADLLNYGYYGWKYRGTVAITLNDDLRVFFAGSLNAGTVAVQYMLSVGRSREQWQQDISADGFFQSYLALFGDPFTYAIDPLVPSDLQQPELVLPFAQGEEWVFTGGPHGMYNSGSAWGAVDFAPPDPPDELVAAQGSCYISPHWVTAVADGVIARSGDGYILLDLDKDSSEYTGWTIMYLHIDDLERIAAGTVVKRGDRLGHPSCQGGFSNGTHLHIGRRYNGEWIPVQCEECAPGVTVPPFVLGEWTVYGYENQEYQGYMTRPGEDGYRQAEQTRDYTLNKVIW